MTISTSASCSARSEDIEEQTLFVESIDLAVGQDHPLARQQAPLAGPDLERQSLILLNTNFALRRHFDLYCIEYGVTPRIAIETNSLNMIVQTVGLGHLATVLPRSIADTQPGLHCLPLLPELPRHTIALIGHRGAYKSAACWAFEELAAEWSDARLPAA
jgi:LysR family cyn operon transcriptional activator